MQSFQIKTHDDLRQAPVSLFLSTESRGLRQMLLHVEARKRQSIWQTFKSAFLRDSVKLALPEAIPETHEYPLIVLAAARCTDVIPWKQPSVIDVSDLCHLSRNVVGDFARALEPLGLITKEQSGRSELIRPTELGDLYTDLIVGKTGIFHSYIERVVAELKQGNVSDETMEKLEVVESALDYTKNIYPKNTLNYEIYDELHGVMIRLIAALRSNQNEEAARLAEEAKESLKAIEESSQKIQSRGIRPILLEDAGERVGSGRVFRPVRSK